MLYQALSELSLAAPTATPVRRVSNLSARARLSPLKHANLNVLGRYSFRASTRLAAYGPCATQRPPTPTRTRRDEPQVC